MGYNRFVDRDVDAQNPRTAQREIPRGAVMPASALGLVVVAAAAFLFCCWLLSTACLWLGLPTLAFLLGYSHCKRFTSLSHLWLGVALGLSPLAAWFAWDGTFGPRLQAPLCLGAAVAVWVAGFDVLYACQDEAFDRRVGLHSIPARFGARVAMHTARLLHGLAFVGFVGFGLLVPLGPAWLVGCGLAATLLVWQHRLLSPRDLSRIDMAFFTANGALAVVMFAAGCVDLWWVSPHRS
jgi:4-hydroxybenzoate polyprenyltransferase